MAVYWQDREWWYGQLTAFGGTSTQGGNGGPGTVYLEDTQHGVNNRTLIFDNNNLPPRTTEISDFSSPETDSGRAWLQPIGKEYELEEVHILRQAHVALHPNITRPHGLKVYSFVGDGTGVIHVGPNQIVIGQFADHELFEVNVYVHRDGHFHLPPTFSCYGIQITTRGYLGVEHMTVAKNCHLYLGLTGSTELANSEGTYKFNSLTVADGGEVTSTSEVGRNSLSLNIDDVTIQGGGILHMVRMRIYAQNFTVDDLGYVRGDTLDASCTAGAGIASSDGSSGAGHGGNGGRGKSQTRVGVAYGHVYEPQHFGCRGGGSGGLGGGIIHFRLTEQSAATVLPVSRTVLEEAAAAAFGLTRI